MQCLFMLASACCSAVRTGTIPGPLECCRDWEESTKCTSAGAAARGTKWEPYAISWTGIVMDSFIKIKGCHHFRPTETSKTPSYLKVRQEVQIMFNVRPRYTLEIVFATSNARIGKELSAWEVFWLGSGGVKVKLCWMDNLICAQGTENGFAQTSKSCLLLGLLFV